MNLVNFAAGIGHFPILQAAVTFVFHSCAIFDWLRGYYDVRPMVVIAIFG